MYTPTYIAIPLWIFAIFGFIYFVLRMFIGIRHRFKYCKGDYSIIISAKNQEETLEGIIRGFILRTGLNGDEEMLCNVVLVDAGSSDRTPEIMRRLAREYCFIKLLKPGELHSFLSKKI